jgi:hypothetical protein
MAASAIKAIDERVDVGAVLRKGAHDKRLYTSEQLPSSRRSKKAPAQRQDGREAPPSPCSCAATGVLTGGGEVNRTKKKPHVLPKDLICSGW